MKATPITAKASALKQTYNEDLVAGAYNSAKKFSDQGKNIYDEEEAMSNDAALQAMKNQNIDEENEEEVEEGDGLTELEQ